MNWYLQNLRCGLKTALFLPSRERFVASWHALMAITATSVLSQVLIEFAVDGRGGEITYSWYDYQACFLVLGLMMAYIIDTFACSGRRVLDIAVAFLNSYYFIFLPYAVAVIVSFDTFHESGVSSAVKYLVPVWAFLVMFRIVGQNMLDGEAYKPVLSGLVAAGAVYLLHSEIHFTRIYYADPPSEKSVSALDILTSEELFNKQAALRRKDLDKLEKSKPGQTDIYALNLASFAYQDVFMRDVNHVSARLKDKLGIVNILPMINNKATVETTPLANTTNLSAYLSDLSSRYMQPKEDIVFIYLTSHGNADTGLAVNLGYKFTQLDLTPQWLQKALKDSGIQNKIIVISACYSGAFIPYLKDDHTMIITASAEDKMSFGCSDKNQLTYFTEAYFTNALSETTDLEKAFDIAKDVVEKREKAENFKEHSDPQIFIGSKIKRVLLKYKGRKIVSD